MGRCIVLKEIGAKIDFQVIVNFTSQCDYQYSKQRLIGTRRILARSPCVGDNPERPDDLRRREEKLFFTHGTNFWHGRGLEAGKVDLSLQREGEFTFATHWAPGASWR